MTKCIINKTGNYIETVLFQPVSALPDQYHIVIKSQFLDAKDPAALQVKYQATVSVSALVELRDALNQLLAQ